jgi:hypothetical protein
LSIIGKTVQILHVLVGLWMQKIKKRYETEYVVSCITIGTWYNVRSIEEKLGSWNPVNLKKNSIDNCSFCSRKTEKVEQKLLFFLHFEEKLHWVTYTLSRVSGAPGGHEQGQLNLFKIWNYLERKHVRRVSKECADIESSMCQHWSFSHVSLSLSSRSCSRSDVRFCFVFPSFPLSSLPLWFSFFLRNPSDFFTHIISNHYRKTTNVEPEKIAEQ